MKKRKSPVILITCLVLFVGTAAFINAYITENSRSEEDKMKDEIAKMQQQPMEKTQDRRDLVNAASQGLAGGDAMIANKRKGNTLVKPAVAPYIPEKNHNNVSPGWFREESADAAGKRDGKMKLPSTKPK